MTRGEKILRRCERLVQKIFPKGAWSCMRKDYRLRKYFLACQVLFEIAFNGPIKTFNLGRLDLYHQRWAIEETFKRIKGRLSLEHVSGLSQQTVVQDVAAKVLCDNAASVDIEVRTHPRRSTPISSHQSRLCPYRPKVITASPAARNKSRQAAHFLASTDRQRNLPPSRRHLKAAQAQTKTPQTHDSETMLMNSGS